MDSAWAYLLVYSSKFGNRRDITEWLDSLPEVTFWYYCLPNCIFLTSTETAVNLAESAYQEFGKSALFLITEIHRDRQGWLPRQAWHMFRNPEDPRLESDD